MPNNTMTPERADDCMGPENLGPLLTSAGRIHPIARTAFPSGDFFSSLLNVQETFYSRQSESTAIRSSAIIEVLRCSKIGRHFNSVSVATEHSFALISEVITNPLLAKIT